jgi:hypothetical protein
MMIPILDAILEEVLSTSVADDPEDPKSKHVLSDSKGSNSKSDEEKNMRAMLCFSVSLASNIGGTATTIGTNLNNNH